MKREQFKEKYTQGFYLGDGLYVHFDGYHLILITEREDGTHKVALEPAHLRNLIKYRDHLYKDLEEIED